MSIQRQAAQSRLNTAQAIIEELGLLRHWAEVGQPVLVGAVAYGLVMNPDIDMEIYCAEPSVEAGFQVVGKIASTPKVTRAKFANHLQDEHQGIYYQLKYVQEDGIEWKVDMWLLPHTHPGPCARDLVDPLNQVLTDELREAILTIKEDVKERQLQSSYFSVHIYQAVVDHGVRTPDDFYQWFAKEQPSDLTFWKPARSEKGNE